MNNLNFFKNNDIKVDRLIDQSQAQIKKINELTEVLGKNSEQLVNHSLAIASVQAIANQNSEKIADICGHMNNHENRINDLEKRLDRIDIIILEHNKALQKIANDVDEMKKTIENINEKILKLQIQMDTNNAENKVERIEDFLERFTEKGLYEFAEFINDLRSQNQPFNLDHVIKGVKIIYEKYKNNN